MRIHELLRDVEILDDFVQEALERLDSAAHHAMALENDGLDDDARRALLQELHTLKGSAGWVGLDEISEVCHELEDLIARKAERDGDIADAADLLIQMVDALQARIDAIDKVVRADGAEVATDAKLEALRLRVRAA